MGAPKKKSCIIKQTAKKIRKYQHQNKNNSKSVEKAGKTSNLCNGFTVEVIDESLNEHVNPSPYKNVTLPEDGLLNLDKTFLAEEKNGQNELENEYLNAQDNAKIGSPSSSNQQKRILVIGDEYDRGGEYANENVQSFLKKDGIGMQYTVPFCPQQNGVAERKNRYLMEMARCMLFDAELPNRFWGEAIVNANYLQNRLPSGSIDVTPYEMWKNKKPIISHIQRFGCYAYAMIPESQRRKLDEKAVKLRFVGYDKHS
ncbi:hypothetical protein JTB14_007661 [Gonioctena quinquepunctata]|nr:hypothetical protein JTB14_007661 [Gonioctena quinquepunctata]